MRGKARLSRALLGGCLEARDVEVVSREGFRFVVPSLLEPIGFHLLVDGVYEPNTLRYVLERLTLGSVFIDVGANIGTFTIPAARLVGGEGCVIATEASFRLTDVLWRNIALNGLSNVRVIRGATTSSPHRGVVPFFEAPIEHFGMGSLGAQFNVAPVDVPTHSLDNVVAELGIGRVDVIKVDVEGFERDVFLGAERILTGPTPPIVVFEFCDWAEARLADGGCGAAQRMLKTMGYSIWRLRDTVGSGAPLANVLTSGFETLVALKAKRGARGFPELV